MLTPAGLKAIAAYAQGIGPNKALVIARKPDGSSGSPTGLVAAAHTVNLAVHPWTMRAENVFLPAELRNGDAPKTRGDLRAEIRAFYAAGVDGVFSDFTGEAVAADAKR